MKAVFVLIFLAGSGLLFDFLLNVANKYAATSETASLNRGGDAAELWAAIPPALAAGIVLLSFLGYCYAIILSRKIAALEAAAKRSQ